VSGSVLSPDWRADSEALALELREDLKLTAAERLDPCALAAFLGIPILSLDAYAESEPEAVAQLRSEEERFSFSAVTVPAGTRRLIVCQPDHPAWWHVVTIAHELAHILLEHEPAPLPLFDQDGRRLSVSLRDEAEADYLAGALLAPRCMVAAVLGRCGDDLSRAAAHFGIGEILMRERVRAAEARDVLSGPEVSAFLRMTEEQMVMVRRLGGRRGEPGPWSALPTI
jgi:hypothetical protein